MPSSSPLSSVRRFRLGVDFHVWDQLFQGSRSYLLGLYRAAITRAPELDFVFFLDDVEGLRAAHAEFRSPNVRCVRMPSRPGPFRLAVQLPWLQWRHRIDLMHMQYRLPLVRPGRYAVTMHDVLFETHPQFFSRSFTAQSHLFYKQAAHRAALLMTVSEHSRAEIARCYGVDPATILITPNAVDARRFHPGDEGAERLAAFGLERDGYILTVGRLEPRKNHLSLIEAYARLDRTSTPPLAIVGQRDFQYREALDAIERLGLQAHVKVIENVDDASLGAVMRHARLFAYTSHAEGFGMPVLEAMASGVPVITSRGTALSEVAGDAAWLVNPTAIDEIATALSALLADPQRRASMKQAGLDRARQFRWDTAAAVLIDGVRRGQELRWKERPHVAV